MTKSISLVLLFLISLATTAQVSNNLFPKNANQKSSISTGNLRTTATGKQRMDSIVTPTSKEAYTYDAAGNFILQDAYQWSVGTKSWVARGRDEYAYDVAGNMISYIRYNWESSTEALIKVSKNEYTYDVNKNQTSEITYEWNALNDMWLQKYKLESTFNANGLISESVKYYWGMAQWVNNGSIEYTYNDKNLLLQETEYSSAHVLYSNKAYTYDTYGNNILEMSSYYDSKGELNYDSKSEYTYDAENNQTLLIDSRWNFMLEDWENENKTEYVFDLQNNIIDNIVSEWSTTKNMWMYSYKYVYSYDNAYPVEDLITPAGFNELFKHKVTNVVSYYYMDGEWMQEMDYTLYYKDMLTTGIDYASSNVVTVYPNPAKDRVVFTNKTNEEATLELFNQQGRLVYNATIIMNEPVSIEQIVEGIYFYRISNSNASNYNGTLIIN